MSEPVLFNFARGRHKGDNAPVPHRCESFAEFREAVLSDRDPRGYVCTSFQTGPHTTKPGKYPGAKPFRCAEYAQPRAWQPFDLDGIENGEAFADCIMRCQRISGFAYTTKSHTADSPRARVIVELTRPVTRAEGNRLGAALESEIADTKRYRFKFDPSVYKGEQPLFLPGPGAEVFRFTGEPIDPDKYLTQAPERAPKPVSAGTGTMSRADIKNCLDRIDNSGDGVPYEGPGETVYFGVAAAVHHETGGKGFDLFSEWSSRSAKNDPAKDRKTWDSLKPGKGYTGAYLMRCAGLDLQSFTADPIDIFAEYPVPPFPAHVMPEPFQRYAASMSAGSGFDPGAYLFVMMLHAGCLLDHRSRLRINANFQVPPFHWGALVDVSGGGKSPVLNAAGAFSMDIYSSLHKESAKAYAEWSKAVEKLKKNDETPPRPPFTQRRTDDATIEAMVDVLLDTPEGVTFATDELTGVIGSIDAYSGRNVSKDRPLWLDAWSGRKDRVVNRRNRNQPVSVDYWAWGVIGAIQPEVLADQFKRGGGSTDGLIQRFMPYQMQPAKAPDLLADHDVFAEVSCSNLYRDIADREPLTVTCDREAVLMMQEYMRVARVIAERTPGGRFREHLGKFPSFLGRIALTLHVLRGGGNSLEPATMRDAITIMRCLYRHSEACYAILDRQTGESRNLTLEAAEAILSQRWDEFTRSDLSRSTASWRNTDPRYAEAAIDQLIELGWLHDITDVPRNRKGRPADGRWLVNPAVHERFTAHAERVTRHRAERYEAIQVLAEERRAI